MTMEHMQPARPLTHDLMKNTLEALEVKLKEILIHSLIDGVFHAVLILEKSDGSPLQIDSRTSDAIALAVRCNAPIMAYENVIEEAGIISDTFWAKSNKGSLATYTLEELENLLQKVVEKEDYESAVRIREMIDRRKNE